MRSRLTYSPGQANWFDAGLKQRTDDRVAVKEWRLVQNSSRPGRPIAVSRGKRGQHELNEWIDIDESP
jgi:hypothetical protein